jgi:DNA-3-methyladenine glycosylase II
MPNASFPVASPYNFELSLKFCRRSRFEIMDDTADNHLRRIIGLEGRPVLIDICCDGTTENERARVSWVCLQKGTISRSRAVSAARRILCADLDLNPFYGRGYRAKPILNLMKKFRGLKPILTPTLFEAAAWAIMGQQVNLDFASVLKKRIVQKFGLEFLCNGDEYYQFPEPNALASVSVEMLKKMQFSTRKAEYILGLAETFVSKLPELSQVTKIEYADAISLLQSIRGIGIWSANYILMRGAGNLNCLPLGDSGLHRAIRRVYGLKDRPGNHLVEKLAEPFTPYRSLFTLYLWYSLMEGKL